MGEKFIPSDMGELGLVPLNLSVEPLGSLYDGWPVEGHISPTLFKRMTSAAYLRLAPVRRTTSSIEARGSRTRAARICWRMEFSRFCRGRGSPICSRTRRQRQGEIPVSFMASYMVAFGLAR